MRLEIYRSMWGTCQAPPGISKDIKTLFSSLKKLGYAGIEASLDDMGKTKKERLHFLQTAKNENLKIITGVYSSWKDYEGSWADLYKSRDDHFTQYTKEVDEAVEMKELAGFKEMHINAHSGSDHWDRVESSDYFGAVLEYQEQLPLSITVTHETHRGRPLSSPWTALYLLQQHPKLRFTADFSHWCVTSERLLGYQNEFEAKVLNKIANRCDHIHARIGTEEAPQVIDIKDDNSQCNNNKLAKDMHYRFWKQIWECRQLEEKDNIIMDEYFMKKKRREMDDEKLINNFLKNHGDDKTTTTETTPEMNTTSINANQYDSELVIKMTPEYGPKPYTPSMPFTGEPLSNVWDVTNKAARELEVEFENFLK